MTLPELVEEHYSLLYRFGYRLSGSQTDAEDLVQQTFLTAQQKLDQLRDADQAKSWLCVILRNIYFKTYRRRKQANIVGVEELDTLVEQPAPELNEHPIDQATLRAALDELPDDFRLTLVLFYFEEMPYKEIAEHLEVPIGTVMSRLARGKAHLRKRLSAQMDD